MTGSFSLAGGLYKIIGEIGAGGGGVVYLAEHTRLGKKVVVKADKRPLTSPLESLRREVDTLKELSHTYIPNVYDFIEEDGKIYTVVDFIDGESLDKPLKRGEKFTQAQIIEWSCQLLEALAYLHSRPPHGILHADIKPANIMLTPQGDIRLIDFNISLALGDEGSVAVGLSFGYSSPEHYGIDYTPAKHDGKHTSDMTAMSESKPKPESDATVPGSSSASSDSNNTSGRKTIMLNARSDIYSLGATLYHLMTGNRPPKDAHEVKAVSSKEYSPAVIDIITKAMQPDQNLRWQSAEEMLDAFLHLRDDDIRVKKYKRTVFFTAALLSLIMMIGAFTVFTGLKQSEQLKNNYLLAEYSAGALRDGDAASAIDFALQALPQDRNIFTPPDTAEAQKALTDALNIYDLSDGFKAHRTVELPSAPLYMRISPDGKTAAVIYSSNLAVFDTRTAEILFTLPADKSALSEVKYIDNDRIIFAGDGGIKAYDIKTKTELWTGKPATAIAVSHDGNTAAGIYRDEPFATVYNIADGSVINAIDFDGKKQRVTVNDIFVNPGFNLFELNNDGSFLAASFANGALKIFDLGNNDGAVSAIFESSDYITFNGGFYENYCAFSAIKNDRSVFAVIDPDTFEQTGGFESDAPFYAEADSGGIFLRHDNMLVSIDPETAEQTPLVNTSEKILDYARSNEYTLISTKDSYMFFDKNANLLSKHEKLNTNAVDLMQLSNDTALIANLDSNIIRIMKLENNSQAEVFSYEPSEVVHSEARISADKKTVMFFNYKRFMLYNISDGSLIADVDIPDSTDLFDQQFRRDESGSWLETVYNNGVIRAYSAADGMLLYMKSGAKPDLTLFEEFFTDDYRIESPLHGTPKVYDIKSGKFVRELESDAYLIYVTQVGEYIIAQYTTVDGYVYGLLMNGVCETLAYLPYLCDIDIDAKELIFDYPAGNLRKSRIYDKTELIKYAREEKS